MTYIESILGDFIKSILTRGIRTLKSARFFPYTSVLLIVVIISTLISFIPRMVPSFIITSQTMDLILYVELAAALSFISVGSLLGRLDAKFQMPLLILLIVGLSAFLQTTVLSYAHELALILVGILYIAWIGIATFSTFSLFRDLFGSNIFGTMLFLGKRDDDGKAMFAVVGWLLAFINASLGYLLYTKAEGSTPLIFTSLIIIAFAFIAVIPLIGIQKKNDVFFSIMNAFYMFSTIRVFLLLFRVLTASSGDTSIWDSVFSMFMALYTIQGAAVKGIKIASKTSDMTIEDQLIEEKGDLGIGNTIARFLSDRGIVLVILGVLLGYHAMQVQSSFGRDNIFTRVEVLAGSNIVVLGYEFNLILSLAIYLVSLLLFFLIPSFRRYANPEVKRIPWAPDYDDLKLMLAGIKSGDIEWKTDTAKLAMGMAKDALKNKLGMKSSENRIQRTVNKWRRESKK
ncbi:MAG: hypothetical protein INQ03_12350 [Candidatus Heimdallarchaeota archaeon]|nr:hypothetical protein [Candidatus Heimdallarchaeota archaeon]